MFVLWRPLYEFTNTDVGAFLAQEKLATLATLAWGSLCAHHLLLRLVIAVSSFCVVSALFPKFFEFPTTC